MPRVLLLCEFPTVSGGEMSMLATLPGLQAAGFEVLAAAPPNGPLAAALAEHQVEVLGFRTLDRAGNRLPKAEIQNQLEAIIRHAQPNLLHANSLAMGRISGPIAAQQNIPSIAHLRDIVRLSRAAVADLNSHRRLLAVSHATRDYHIASGLAAEQCFVCHNGIDTQKFQPRPVAGYLHAELRLAADRQFIAAIGQISLRKGLDVLLAAARQVATQNSTAHFLIVGERFSGKAESIALEQRLRAQSQQPPLAGRVHWLGQRSDIAQLLNELTLLVHPARQEPLGRVPLEAAASGVPVIATDVGGTREIFPSHAEPAARLIPPDAPDQLATEILSLLQSRTSREQLSRAARSHISHAFPLDLAAQSLLAHYHAVLASAAG